MLVRSLEQGMLKSLKSNKPESFLRQIKQAGSLRSVATNLPTNQFFLRHWGGKDRQFECQKIFGIEFAMNCCDHKLAFTLSFTFLVFCAASTHGFGQIREAKPLPNTLLEAEIAEPSGLTEGKKVNTRTPYSSPGSLHPFAIATDETATSEMTSVDASSFADAFAIEVTAPQSDNLPDSQLGKGPAANSKSDDYWKPVPSKAEGVEYEDLDAETSRDLFNAESIRNLRKPMRDIRIVAEDDAEAPKNLAAQFMVKEPVLEIVAAGISPPRPDRYPIVFKHRPLYFEQPRLERCGRGCGVAQNAISAGQFCLNAFFLPYHMCKTKPGCPVASGGDCLSCEPYSRDCNILPLSYSGMASEAAAFAGFTFLLL